MADISPEEIKRFKAMVKAQGGLAQLKKVIASAQKKALSDTAEKTAHQETRSAIVRASVTNREIAEEPPVQRTDQEVVLNIPHFDTQYGARGTYQDPEREHQARNLLNTAKEPAGAPDENEVRIEHGKKPYGTAMGGFMSTTTKDT